MSAPENMPNFPGFVLRASTYYYRRFFPKDLRDSFGKREALWPCPEQVESNNRGARGVFYGKRQQTAAGVSA